MTRYATTTDLGKLGLPAASLVNVTTAVQESHLDATGARIDTYLRSRHTLPFASPYPAELIECNAVMAAYTLLVNYRGYDPSAVDDGFRLRYEDCLSWLKALGNGTASVSQTADATADTSEGRPRVSTGGANRAHGTGDTGESRGW